MTTERQDSRQMKENFDVVADGLTSVMEAASFLSLSRSTLYELMDSGHLRYVKIGRARRVPWRALHELAAENLRGGWRQGEES
jgi:excisionase family DNA binding protein